VIELDLIEFLGFAVILLSVLVVWLLFIVVASAGKKR
jgi:hypothetical protein